MRFKKETNSSNNCSSKSKNCSFKSPRSIKYKQNSRKNDGSIHENLIKNIHLNQWNK